MSDSKRGGWLSRLLGSGERRREAPERSLGPPSTQGVQALDVLFGAAGRAAAAAHDVESARSISDGAPLRNAPPPGTAAYAPPADAAPPATPLPRPTFAIDNSPSVDLTGLAPTATAALEVQLRIVVHVADRGDVHAGIGTWAGERGSGLQIEGLTITPIEGIDPDDLEYQALLDDGTMTSWHRDEAFCGTRGSSRALHGFALRLVSHAASTYRISYITAFLDGSQAGPSADGALCAAASKAGLEALYVMVDRA